MTYTIYVITDSRGALLQRYLSIYNAWPNVTYKVEVYKGRGVGDLWSKAKMVLHDDRANFVYIMGGICDLSSKYIINGRREYWINKRPKDQISSLVLTLNKIYKEAEEKNFHARVAFLQELGCDFIKYNKVTNPAPWMVQQQLDFDRSLPLLHKATRALNFKLGVRTPWTLDSIFKRTHKKKMYPRYHLLKDGLHPTFQVAYRMAHYITKDVSEAHKN